MSPVNTEAVGKQWPAATYEVGREKIREYANVIGDDNPVHHDREAALAAGFRDVVAPPMFCVVYSAARDGAGDPRPRGRDQLRGDGPRQPGVRLGRAGLLGRRDHDHGARRRDLREGRQGLLRLRVDSVNQDGDQVVRGTWTNIVRGV